MQLTEQHIIHRNDPRFAIIDAAAFKSKNLYNAALYEVRQAFFNEGKYLTYNALRKRRPDAFAKGVAGYVVHPVRLAV